ncbi:conserved hypothetical protein [Gluconacetobacter diazotrophicus PA1 5]|uniref:Uncharacterized protein n=1 Tax=Gluconacetobacter diazotrophicus (strain ATCC 49037 / DSM 5601 / CCUG 37298 / CIP 103539 / LMG 7603 / PAl5) TaxID=272568 RepID=A9HS16_GLUDA|nr:DUF3574 domain-containing protein [Gluconacetobacter diazotrophicus]ACI53025.1 conserved hypothetical protein [Gluconacetobacter diazotrophicus PA1 5]TWB07696.1 uncharacterized protein DUF3574 [Gluconacetobacter diazotrophicus]CAP57013.1 conserved hypothetical protein [Gluconacetobacter diazotrophicus PA1 5]
MRAIPILGLLVLATLAGCAPASRDEALCARFGAHRGIEISLLFGLTRPDGGVVTDAEWADFLRREVTPRFPDGLSVFQAMGQWRDRVSGQVTAEPSRIVWIAADASAPDLRARLDAIRAGYRHDFQQQSVGLTIRGGCQTF